MFAGMILAAVAVAVTPTPTPSAVANCSMRSMADFGAAFHDSENLVVGPLAMVGAGAFTPPSVVRGFGGQKYPLLVKAGHRVTIRVPASARRFVGLGYGPLPQGEITLERAHPEVTFIACRHGEASGSTAGGPVTFWSGGLVAQVPHCVPLDVFVDGDTVPRRVEVELGARCHASLPTVACDEAIGHVESGREGGYRVVLRSVSVAPAYLPQMVETGDASWPYWQKAGLVIRAGRAPAVRVSVPTAWRQRAAITWGGSGNVGALRIERCRPPRTAWHAYAGGFYLRSPSACLPLVFQVGERTATVRFGLGRRCPSAA